MGARFAFVKALPVRPHAMAVGLVLLGTAVAGCSDVASPTPTERVEIVYHVSVPLGPDIPDAIRDCVTAALVARVHPSWRDYVPVPMSVNLTLDEWVFTFNDVPANETVRFRINDRNWCDSNATGAVLQDVFANGVRLTQNTTTPGPGGDEPGFSFTVDESGAVRQ